VAAGWDTEAGICLYIIYIFLIVPSASTDLQAFKLLEFLYAPFPLKLMRKGVHTWCIEMIKPGTMMHIGNKFLQMAAANCTDGGHYNTATIASIWREKNGTQCILIL
jgi:hypothetical protein